jgi:hypothetical protein
VEHIHVHSGGQAVVGVVERPGDGGQAQLEKQPYGTIGDASQPAVWRADTERTALPVTSDAQRPLQNTRRAVPRGCQRAIKTPLSTATTRPKQLPAGAGSPRSFGPLGRWQEA